MARNTATRIRQIGGNAPSVEPDDGPVALPVFIMTSAIGVLLVLALGVWFGIAAVESDIENQVVAILEANGQTDVQVEVEGRVVTLSGLVNVEAITNDDDEAQAYIDTRLVPGIAERLEVVDEVIDDGLRFTIAREAREIVVDPDPLSISWVGTAATIAGTVSDSATLDLLTLVAEGSGSTVAPAWEGVFSTVDATGLSVREGTPSERSWLPTIITLAREMKPLLAEGEIFVNPIGEVVRVTGEFDVRQQQVRARETARETLAGITFSFSSALEYNAPPTELPPPPEEQVIELQTNLDDLIEGKVVEFEVDSDVITAGGRALLDEVVVALRQFPGVMVEIGGHTDDVGSEDYNLDLSQRRAAAVLTYLLDHGEDAARFVVVGYGESQPVEDNATADGRARNRRIEFTAFSEEATSP